MKTTLVISIAAMTLALTSIYISWQAIPTPNPEIASDDALLAAKAVKAEVFSKFFEIFVTISAILSALCAILGVGAYSTLKKRIDQEVRSKIDERVRVAQARTLCIAFNEFAFSSFRRYEPLLQRHLSEIANNEDQKNITKSEICECLEHIGVAEVLAEHGYSAFDELNAAERQRFLEPKEGKKAFVNILNQTIYTATAKMLASQDADSRSRLEELSSLCEELYKTAISKELCSHDYNWWESIETIAFYKWSIGKMVGDACMEREGRILVRDLVNQKPPKGYLKRLPADVIDTIKREYKQNGFEEPL